MYWGNKIAGLWQVVSDSGEYYSFNISTEPNAGESGRDLNGEEILQLDEISYRWVCEYIVCHM